MRKNVKSEIFPFPLQKDICAVIRGMNVAHILINPDVVSFCVEWTELIHRIISHRSKRNIDRNRFPN